MAGHPYLAGGHPASYMPFAPGSFPGQAPVMPQMAYVGDFGYPQGFPYQAQGSQAMMPMMAPTAPMPRVPGGVPGVAVPEQDPDEATQSEEEDKHFADVCYSLMAYHEDAACELKYLEEVFQNLKDPHDLELLKIKPAEMMKEMHQCACVNAAFLAMLVESDEDARMYSRVPRSHHVQERNSMKVRTVLRQFVRDWADEGQPERDSQYGGLLNALERYVPVNSQQGRRPRVLTPGSGLSRLPFEVARRGYSAQGNEFSYHMLQGSKWVLNETSDARIQTIFPFALGMEHRKCTRDHLRGVLIPDVCPSQILCPDGVTSQPQDFSMTAGEFVEVYSSQVGQWDAVLTCFFLDTAKNIFLYIRTIAAIIRPGGLWSNIGPLLYHYAEQPNAVSIELSWAEIKPTIEKYFEFKEEEKVKAYYTTNERGLFHTCYSCKFFVVVRNERPAEGYSVPVF